MLAEETRAKANDVQLYSVRQAAEMLDLDYSYTRLLCARLSIGYIPWMGRGRVLTPEDLQRLRDRPIGKSGPKPQFGSPATQSSKHSC